MRQNDKHKLGTNGWYIPVGFECLETNTEPLKPNVMYYDLDSLKWEIAITDHNGYKKHLNHINMGGKYNPNERIKEWINEGLYKSHTPVFLFDFINHKVDNMWGIGGLINQETGEYKIQTNSIFDLRAYSKEFDKQLIEARQLAEQKSTEAIREMSKQVRWLGKY